MRAYVYITYTYTHTHIFVQEIGGLNETVDHERAVCTPFSPPRPSSLLCTHIHANTKTQKTHVDWVYYFQIGIFLRVCICVAYMYASMCVCVCVFTCDVHLAAFARHGNTLWRAISSSLKNFCYFSSLWISFANTYKIWNHTKSEFNWQTRYSNEY